ncbi:hypothetical protein OXPF_31050 [Oxobacter pfennigii]|uniref:Uncharacterized protein n=1 Tax=Oxobacter pfennigii TaxID=36849 RepID=A0A0P8Y9S9_9CLOT|nr:hypothetical protein [Oxobacter pfennigii]KPU43663.1 hypothetical protein OXPF_31050 [Oxobacter pfennigii]
MKEFLWEFRFVIIILAALALYALFAWQDFKTKAYALMLRPRALQKIPC